MSTTKKTVAAAKKTAVDTTVKTEEVKAPEVKEAVEVKAAETKTAAKKTTAKTTAKKAAVKTTETVEAAEEKKAPAKKAAVKKETTMKVAIQYADKNYTTEDLAKIANDVWVYDHGKDAADLKDVQLYVKPEESKVYYVFNGEIAGDFNI